MKRAKAIELGPALAMKRFHQKERRRWTLWGFVIASNLTWIATAIILGSGWWGTTKVGIALTDFYLEERSKWIEPSEAQREQLRERNLEIARMVAFQTSSPGDVLELAKKVSTVLGKTYGSKRDFLEIAVPQAIRMQVQYEIPASAIIAMAIYESGYGRSDLARHHHNYFGMKAYHWNGKRVNMPTVDSGVKTRANFRVYASLGDGFQGFAEFLRGKGRYRKAFTKTQGVDFVREVLKAGYCPDSDYLANIKTIMKRHNLQQLDTIISAGQDAPYQMAWNKKKAKLK
ncbi:MAG: glucosaminidase domain-containing protein [Verrucomicrobiota bacterium]